MSSQEKLPGANDVLTHLVGDFLQSEGLRGLPKIAPNPRIAAVGRSAQVILASPTFQSALKAYNIAADFAAYQTCEELADNTTWDLALVLAPCKPAAYELTRHNLTPLAKQTQAVDTILRIEDNLLGVNTNLLGAHWAIERLMGDLTPQQILVAGTSATARSVVIALCNLFPESGIDIIGRNPQKAQAIIDICKTGEVVQNVHSQNYDLVVNATSVGNANDGQRLDYPLEDSLKPGMHFFDVIIGSTYLQQAALSKGCIVASGAAMQYAVSALRASLLNSK